MRQDFTEMMPMIMASMELRPLYTCLVGCFIFVFLREIGELTFWMIVLITKPNLRKAEQDVVAIIEGLTELRILHENAQQLIGQGTIATVPLWQVMDHQEHLTKVIRVAEAVLSQYDGTKGELWVLLTGGNVLASMRRIIEEETASSRSLLEAARTELALALIVQLNSQRSGAVSGK